MKKVNCDIGLFAQIKVLVIQGLMIVCLMKKYQLMRMVTSL